MLQLTEEQQDVFNSAIDFLKNPSASRPYFLFEGLAGCGKSTVLAKIAKTMPSAHLGTFTGKAASVLARKTGLRVRTLHSLIYEFLGRDDVTKELRFGEKIEHGEWKGMVALVDESSCINDELAHDLLATGCRVIACGDPGQLPPVRGESFFRDPDAVLRTVHRQALDSAIIRQAHRVRAGGDYEDDGADFCVRQHIDAETILGAGVVLCWRNATRLALNSLLRRHRGIRGEAPVVAGEPLMCLRNDHRNGLLNGAVYPALYDRRSWDPIVIENERGHEIEVEGWVEGLEPAQEGLPFALGYCATVHKAQGSEWDRLVLVDEYARLEDREKWLYTALTRASKSIVVQRA